MTNRNVLPAAGECEWCEKPGNIKRTDADGDERFACGRHKQDLMEDLARLKRDRALPACTCGPSFGRLADGLHAATCPRLLAEKEEKATARARAQATVETTRSLTRLRGDASTLEEERSLLDDS